MASQRSTWAYQRLNSRRALLLVSRYTPHQRRSHVFVLLYQ